MKKESKGVITTNIIESVKANKKPLNTLKTSVLVGLRGNIQNLEIEIWDKQRIAKEIEANQKLNFMANEPFQIKGIIEVANDSGIVVAYVNNSLLAMLLESNVVTVDEDGKTYSFDNSEVEFTATSVKKTNVAKLTAEQLKEFSISELKGILDSKGIDYKSSDNKDVLISKLL